MAQDRVIIEKSKRMDILISSYAGDKPVGRSTKYSFNGIVDGNKQRYDTFNHRLGGAFKEYEGTTVPMDVEISEHEYNNRTYQDHIILQMYVDGKPVSTWDNSNGQSGNQGSSQGSSQGNSQGNNRAWLPDPPEKVASIEAQTIYNGAIELLKAGTIKIGSDFADKAIAWGIAGLYRSTVFRGGVTAPAKTLLKAAKEMGAQEIDWNSGTKFDPEELKGAMAEARWKDTTLKSWCKNTIKVGSDGSPLDDRLELIPFVRSMSSDGVTAAFKHLEEIGVPRIKL